MFDFKRKTLVCLGYHFSKSKMTINPHKFEGAWPVWPPWLRIWGSPRDQVC